MGIIAPRGHTPNRRTAGRRRRDARGADLRQLTADAQESEETWRAATRELLAEKKLTLLYDRPGRFELLSEDGRPHEP